MRHLIMGTAGHVDHGKTALIKALTNIDCDTHPEEKRRGITINLGFSYLKLSDNESIGIIDVPGHKDFINTMVSGACGIDFVLLVIAADSGIMPQTREHVNIISALGIKKGIVALAKVDLVDEELAEMAKLEIYDFLKDTTLKESKIIGVSSISGYGIKELIKIIEETVSQVEERDKGELFRMYIDRTFVVKGIGIVITGTVLNGSLKTGQDVFLLPGGSIHKVRAMERHGTQVESVTSGDRAAIQLTGIKKEDIQKGSLISDKNIGSTKMADASIKLFSTLSNTSNWSVVTFHSGTFETQARMHKITEDENNLLVQFLFEKPGYILTNDKCIIRNSSGDKTLGGGIILDSSPLHHKKRTPVLIESLKALSESKNLFSDTIKLELKKEIRPYLLEQIAEKLNYKTEEILDQTDNLKDIVHYSFQDNNLFIYIEYDKLFKNKTTHFLKTHHKENPLSDKGLTSAEILGKLNLIKISCAKDYTEGMLLKMKQEQIIEFKNNTWIIKGHKQDIDDKSLDEINWLENEFLKYDCQKPVFSDIEAKVYEKKITKDKLKKYLHFLTGKGKLIINNNEYIHSDIVKKYKTILTTELEKNTEGIDMDDFRQDTGISKRLAPLLISIFENQKIIFTKKNGTRIQLYLKK